MTRILAILATVVALPAAAETRLEYVDEKSGETRTAISIRDGKVRLDNADSGTWTLYDRSTNTLVAVNPADSSYMVMDEKTMQQAAGKISEAMAAMRRQLEQMPPEQREMIEKRMGGLPGAGKSAMNIKVDRTGKTMNRGGYECRQVFFSIGSTLRSELCVVDAQRINMPDEDRETYTAMRDQMQSVAKSMSRAAGWNRMFDFGTIGGMPVYKKQDRERTGEVLKVMTDAELEAKMFTVPESFREEKFNFTK